MQQITDFYKLKKCIFIFWVFALVQAYETSYKLKDAYIPQEHLNDCPTLAS